MSLRDTAVFWGCALPPVKLAGYCHRSLRDLQRGEACVYCHSVFLFGGMSPPRAPSVPEGPLTIALAQDKLVDAILPTGILPKNLPNSMNVVCERFRMGTFWSVLIVPNIPWLLGALGLQALERNGGDDGTRTRDLCRDRAAF